MKCLVTGATGFLGSNLVHELVKAGWDVRASGMHGSETKYIDDLPIEFVFGDITKPDEVDGLVKNCEVVFNVAGDTSFWKKHYARQHRINVEAPSIIAEACHKHGVKRMIQTSTIDVFGYNTTGGSFDEQSGRFNFDNLGYKYGETKCEGDLRLRTYSRDGLDIVFVHPGFIIGPYDHTMQIGRVFFDLKENKLPGVPCGGSSFCHVTEVAKAHIAAAEKGRAGESYICAGMMHSNMTHREVFERMASAIGAKAPKATLSRRVLVAYAAISELISGLTGKEPQLNPGMAHYLSCPVYALSGKAIRELDYSVPDIDVCIGDALDWYRANGHPI